MALRGRKKATATKAPTPTTKTARSRPEIDDDDADNGAGKFPDKPENEQPDPDGGDASGADNQTRHLLGLSEAKDQRQIDRELKDDEVDEDGEAIDPRKPSQATATASAEGRSYIDREVERAGLPEGEGVTSHLEKELAAAQSTGETPSRIQRGESEAEAQRAATTSNPPEEQHRSEYRRSGTLRVGEQVPLAELNREHRAQRFSERNAANIAANAAASAVRSALGESTYVDPATAPDGMVNPRTGVRMRKPARGPVEASA